MEIWTNGPESFPEPVELDFGEDQREHDFHFIVRDFHDLVSFWGEEAVLEYMRKNFKDTFNKVMTYAGW